MKACVFRGQLMHQRVQPFEHKFSYPIQYIHTPLQLIGHLPLATSKFGLLSLRPQDHGDHQSQDLQPWARALLRGYDFRTPITSINLLAIPRSLGMHFNPVSFWFCLDAEANLRAVICQVNNTFGETHSYLCRRADEGIISASEYLSLGKKLHVSPFFPRSGYYKFRFDYRPAEAINVIIDYHDSARQLRTSLCGRLAPLSQVSTWSLLKRQPFIGISAYARIHKQAWKLWRRGAKYHSKPQQLQPDTSAQ